MNNKTRAAVTGGVLLGLLSSLPFVNFVNLCCCAWVLLGGGLAAYLYIKSSPTAVSAGEGAQLGLLAGAVGIGVNLLVGIPLGLVFNDVYNALFLKIFASVNPQAGETFRQQMELARAQPLTARLPTILVTALINAVVTLLFATLGGLLGVSLFEKRKATASDVTPPPPPPDFGVPPPPMSPVPPGSYGN